MKEYIDKMLSEVIWDHIKKVKLEKLSISERIGIELSIAKLKIVRELISKFL
jgi:hypothetical protein